MARSSTLQVFPCLFANFCHKSHQSKSLMEWFQNLLKVNVVSKIDCIKVHTFMGTRFYRDDSLLVRIIAK